MIGPSWIKPASSSIKWLRRHPFCANTTGKSTSTAHTGRLTPPEDWDDFWTYAAAAELRVTTYDGRTAVPFDDVNLNIAGRSGYLIVRPTVTTAAVMEVYWLYWDADGASDASTTIADATDITFAIETSGPLGPLIPARSTNGQTTGTPIQKQAGEEVFIHVDPGEAARHLRPVAGWYGDEGVQHMSIAAPPGLTATLADMRILVDASRRVYLRAAVSGGTSPLTAQAIDVTLQTTLEQTLVATASFAVQDLT